MQCPKCQTALDPVRVDEVDVDQCSGCQGVWFDALELGPLLDKHEAGVKALLEGERDEALNAQRSVSCPRDQAQLLRVYSLRNNEVILDVCAECRGVWLDGGEFQQIKAGQPDVRLHKLISREAQRRA